MFKRFLCTLGAAPTTSQTGCLGCVIIGTNVAADTIISSGTTKTISTLSIPPGIWIVSFYVNCYPSIAVTTTNYQGIKYNLSTIINTFDFSILLSGTEGSNYSVATTLPSITGAMPLTITSTTTYYLNATITYTAGEVRTSGSLLSFKATRVG